MTYLRRRMIDDMRIRNYSPRTIDAYTRQVAEFAKHFGRSPQLLGPEHVREYQIVLRDREVSWTKFNQTSCSLRLLYNKILKLDWAVEDIPYSRKPRRLPVVMSRRDALRLLGAIQFP